MIYNMEQIVFAAPVAQAAGARVIGARLPVWPLDSEPMGFMGLVSSPVYPGIDSWLVPWLRDDAKARLDDAKAMVSVRTFAELNPSVELPANASVRERKQLIFERYSRLLDESYIASCARHGERLRFLLGWGFFGLPGDISAFVHCRIREDERDVSVFQLAGCGVWDSSPEGLREALSMAMRSGLGGSQ